MSHINHMTDQDKNLYVALTENLRYSMTFKTLDDSTRNQCRVLLSRLVELNHSNGNGSKTENIVANIEKIKEGYRL